MTRFVQQQFSCRWCFALVVAIGLAAGGCAQGPTLLLPQDQKPIDRRLVEYPTGFELRPYVRNLTSPTAIAFDEQGWLFIAEGGLGKTEPRIFGYRPDGSLFFLYPSGQRIPFDLFKTGFRVHGPIGGMVAHGGKIFVSHRDENRRGVITAFGYDGTHTTVVGDLPAQGDYSVTDLAMAPNGRLYFGLGTATNSGVVGLDNWTTGWVEKYPATCDRPWQELKLLGYRFDTRNPRAGLLGGDDIAVTAPFQHFGTSTQTRVRRAPNGKPTGAIYSISPGGGDLRVEAHGLRHPRGLEFNEYGRLYMTNGGMELRGTRPVKDDPDVLLRLVPGTWYGWPDFSADLQPITEQRFQPPAHMIMRSGYPDVSFLIDHPTSELLRPDRNTLLQATFAPLSGAAKLDFVPPSGAFAEWRGSAIVAMSGDRAPFATNGMKLVAPQGYKVVRVDVDTRQVKDFVRNTRGVPASHLGKNVEALERPVDVKFGPDGALYILDMGKVEIKNGRDRVQPRGGRIFRLVSTEPPPAEAVADPM